MTYENLRVFADTWGLVLLFVLFAILILWLFRRGSNEAFKHAARIPMDAPEHPDGDRPAVSQNEATDKDTRP